jgi:hypothetical protein
MMTRNLQRYWTLTLMGLVVTLMLGVPVARALEVEIPEGMTVEPTVWGPGEKMVFKLSYGIVDAGEGTLEVKGVTQYRGRTCYEIESKANSNRFFSSFYKVRDKITSYLDVENLHSRYFYKRLREGDFKKTVEVDFDHEENLAHYRGGDSYPITEGALDVLSAFYFARNLDLGVGDEHNMSAHSSRETADLKIVVHGKERVEVEAGTWDCYVVEPILKGEGLFKHEGKLMMYITADENRIPILVKTKVPVGTIDIELKEYYPGTPLVRKTVGTD